MKIEAILTHTAVLVESVDKSVEFFKTRAFIINAPEQFETEGTREIYIGGSENHSSRLLLVEAQKEGPYRRALTKRGTGLHHIGLAVSDVDAYCMQLGAAGWLLHTYSLKSYKKNQVYLVRPGVPLMLEVNNCLPKKSVPSLVRKLQIPIFEKADKMLASINCTNTELVAGKSALIDLGAELSQLKFTDFVNL